MDINMSITSFYFLCFYAVLLMLYYLVPGKMQWVVLFCGSAAYYLLSGQGILLLYPLVTGSICFAAGHLIEKAQKEKADDKKRKLGLLLALAGALGPLAVLKYTNFFVGTYNGLTGIFGGKGIDLLAFLVPLGISYYTFTMLGYVIDIYYGIGKSASSFGGFLLYGTYFPTLISGPISSFGEMKEQFFAEHKFDYEQVTRGMQRMLWGFFKKLVISERLALVVGTVFGDYETYGGTYCFLAAVLFVLQLYTDFSGCMDIVLGLSQTFGLMLPENFKTPFFSKSVAEFWRRWHITLGNWMKNYVFYPLLRTSAFNNLGKSLRKRLGKKAGKQLTTFTAMFVLWFTVGIWHGPDWKYVLGSGLLHWLYIVLGEACEPISKKVCTRLHLSDRNPAWNVFRMVRTFLLITFAFVFFRAQSVRDGFGMLKSMFTVWNPQVLWDGGIFALGLDWIEFSIAIVSLLLLLAVSLLQDKGMKIRETIGKKKLPVRWIIWYALLFYVILLGYYGPGYSAAEFIYQGF